MKKSLIYLLSLVVLISVLSCSTRLTRQFILPVLSEGKKHPEKDIAGWKIKISGFSAYKNVIKIEQIENPNRFWLTISASHKQSKKEPVQSDIKIDSVIIRFLPDNEEFVLKPTREYSFNSNNGKHKIKGFDFFEDQGLIIPLSINSILLSFIAVIEKDNEIITEETIEYKMIRSEQESDVPFLQQ